MIRVARGHAGRAGRWSAGVTALKRHGLGTASPQSPASTEGKNDRHETLRSKPSTSLREHHARQGFSAPPTGQFPGRTAANPRRGPRGARDRAAHVLSRTRIARPLRREGSAQGQILCPAIHRRACRGSTSFSRPAAQFRRDGRTRETPGGRGEASRGIASECGFDPDRSKEKRTKP